MRDWSLPLVGKPLDEYTDEEWEAEKLQARADHEAMIAAQKPLSFEDKLNILAQQYQPEFNTDVTADQILTGIFAPTDLTFDDFLFLVNECVDVLGENVTQHDKVCRLDPLGEVRADRYYAWLALQEPERAVLGAKTAVNPRNGKVIPVPRGHGYLSYQAAVRQWII